METDPEELDQFDEEEMVDPFDALATFLSTEDGETIATSLAGLKDAAVLIAKSLEKHNMISIKILTALNTYCSAPKGNEA
jgi:hypothetical protein